MEHEGRGSAIGIVGGECDPHTYQLSPLQHLHSAVTLGYLQLKRGGGGGEEGGEEGGGEGGGRGKR